MTRFLSTAFVFFLWASASFAQPLHPCAQLVWQDEFDETSLDLTKWTPQLGDGCDINLCGWGNNELEYYTDRPENLKVESGNLVITSLKETYSGRDYTSAKISSLQKGDFTYGRIEARIKVPQGAGSWPAFWMLSTDETYGPWPASGEIDIMEFQGKNPNFISGTVHYGTSITDHHYEGLVYHLPSGQNYYDDFHVFTIEWDSTSIKWYMDDNLYHTFTTDKIKPYHWPFDQNFYIILNNAVGGDLGGPVDDNSMPQTMEVDYVRVYSSPLNFNILGHQQLFTNASNEKYDVPAVSGATDYQWTVPTGASILTGQGTPEITVNWGGTSSAGDVSLSVIKSCGSLDLTLPVHILDDNSCMLILDDMNGNTNVVYDSWTSPNFYPSFSNPNPTGNTSSMVGYLVKTDMVGTNQFIMKQLPITDFSLYESGQRILYMDVYSNAVAGTTVELRFQNSAKSQSGYPSGTRTVLRAKTSLSKKWETLVFAYDHVEDATTLISEIDQVAVLFNPEETIANKYFAFDNIKRGLIPYHSISGNATPNGCDVSNQVYSVTTNSSTNYAWTVPAGTSINSGQSSNQISVNWGTVKLGKIYFTETTGGCTGYSASLDVAVATCTGILDGTSRQALDMYPNPSRDLLTVTYDLPAPTDVKIIISSSLGETLLNKLYAAQIGTFSEQFSIRELKPGSYTVQLVTGTDIRSSQLIKY